MKKRGKYGALTVCSLPASDWFRVRTHIRFAYCASSTKGISTATYSNPRRFNLRHSEPRLSPRSLAARSFTPPVRRNTQER